MEPFRWKNLSDSSTMRKVAIFLAIVLILGVLYKLSFVGSKVSSAYHNDHEQLFKMNSCDIGTDCSLIYGSVNTKCIYLVKSESVNRAIEILKKTGERVKDCKELEIASFLGSGQ